LVIDARYRLGGRDLFLVALICLAWAGNFITSKLALLEFPPLLFTALSNQFWTSNLSQPMASLPVTIFKFAMSPYENWQQLAWAGVFIITMGVLVLNIAARLLFRDKH